MAEKDITEKTLESYNDVFADILNVLLFNGERVVSKDSLEQTTLRSFYKADNKLREQERDTAKFWNHINFHIALFGIENETEPEDDLPLRLAGYDGVSYRNQLYYIKDEKGKRQKNNNPRYPVVTLVLYFGYKKHWNKPLTLHGAIGKIPSALKPYVNNYKVNLFEIAYLSDEQLEMFQSDFRIVADYFVQMRKNKNYVPTTIQVTHVREVMQLLSVLTKDDRFEEAYNNSESREEMHTMLEWLDNAINDRIAKEKPEWQQEGRIFEYIDLRREDGFSDEEIAMQLPKRFHLTPQQVEKYLKNPIPTA